MKSRFGVQRSDIHSSSRAFESHGIICPTRISSRRPSGTDIQPGQPVALFYDRGLELVARLDDMGEVISTIANRKAAAIRLRLDAPVSAYFFNAETGLRIDLLFDFPIHAATLAEHATRIKIRAQLVDVASERDLLRLKKIAKSRRSVPGDTEDIAFLESRRKRSR